METRPLYRHGPAVAEVGFGAWAIGGSWGDTDDDESIAAMETAVRAGVTFFDTADVYGDGRSERLVGRIAAEHDVVVATKLGRRADLAPKNWTHGQFLTWLDRSRRNLGMDHIDLVQLHCLGDEVYGLASVWEGLRDLQSNGVIGAFGVSVETVDEARAALQVEGLATIQLIANLFRMKPVDEVFDAARESGAGLIVRVPLASGMLTGKFTSATTFAADDHRDFNRDGQAFDVGETFAGVPWDVGLAAVQQLRPLVPAHVTMAQFALRWILDHDAVSVVIPGARTQAQARGNAASSALDPLSAQTHAAVRAIYDELVAPHVHHRW